MVIFFLFSYFLGSFFSFFSLLQPILDNYISLFYFPLPKKTLFNKNTKKTRESCRYKKKCTFFFLYFSLLLLLYYSFFSSIVFIYFFLFTRYFIYKLMDI